MTKGRIRHMFPGGNTSQGFFSYYDYILGQEEANRIICIKGGPGVGKSTFMKKIGKEMVERGYDVEFMHCSSDNNSLDGVVIPSLKIALLDGTAPHVVDPKNPGAVDEIIHLGDFWNEKELRKNKEGILRDNKEVGRTFRRAYRYIKAAYFIYEDNMEIVSRCMDNAKVNKLSDRLKDEIMGDKDIADRQGRDRKLFASAITPNGLVNYLDTLINTDKVYVLKGMPGTGTERVIQKIKEAAVERGYDVESFYCALNPYKLEHLIIPGLNVSITTSNDYHSANVENTAEYNLDEYLDMTELGKYQETLENNKKNFEMLLDTAIKTIAKAKAFHDSMENYYIPNMDFDAVERCYEATLNRILEYAKECH
ncbi:MAG TPA: ATPase [Hungateiclostridium thermocellum]|uniref:ATPase n=2 Tax=Acetivibrio thermocellus TaxID=1515 RepID=A3DCJ3_ACET2|nr:PRK06851 family protein [Acetivibrio thermocellus]CDG35148.1 ATPase [Acetivibrio thermocellus BC1]ABN51672.1 ATPase [Acetivibrio thermocellus ATCC 27405]ADU74843.1 ATPase [Acetivibrio thermocellus DSM 1313]ALX08797.1 ArgK protein [Acetivibrio thermocellus AD2]ANV76548.1 ArgK protein [Acetivibrio thermocellus DSM 2360]